MPPELERLQGELSAYNEVGAGAADNAENIRDAIIQEEARVAALVTKKSIDSARTGDAKTKLTELRAQRDALITKGVDIVTLTNLDKQIDLQTAISRGVKERDIPAWLAARARAEVNSARQEAGYVPEHGAPAYEGKTRKEIIAEGQRREDSLRPRIIMPTLPMKGSQDRAA